MAVAVDSATVVRLTENVLSTREKRVRNDGPGSCGVSKDPQLTPSAAHTFVLAANEGEDVTLAPGEALYAICPAGQTASIEVI